MNSAFEHSKVQRELACEFLGVFARFEYALKATGFATGDGDWCKADWNRFAEAIQGVLTASKEPGPRAAIDYLLTKPPGKEVLDLSSGTVQFVESPPDATQNKARQVLTMVRRVRNNLFHGGKFGPPAPSDPYHDQRLVEHSLVVLRFRLSLNADVALAYER
ncbi:MAG TPA: hypothetical protein VJH03_12570 [Blastocatellia bacterium]|nr:hypothetical protein [Blastocatellia bacterium]